MDPFFLSMVETQNCYRELKTYVQKKTVIDINRRRWRGAGSQNWKCPSTAAASLVGMTSDILKQWVDGKGQSLE